MICYPRQFHLTFSNTNRFCFLSSEAEGFDFDLSMGVTCNSPSVDYVDSVSALPPITSSSNINGKRDYDALNQNNQSEVESGQYSSMPNVRGRGMSFELFAFNQHESLPSDPIDLKEEALNGGRPRGDSIIFDPVSFSDGGIHEENALQRIRRNSVVLDDTDELALMNTPGFVEGSSSHLTVNNYITSNQGRGETTRETSRVSKSGGRSNTRQTKSGANNISTTKSKLHGIPISIVSGHNLQNSENTIHMPQGSAAAAAAAASLSSQIIPCSLNGTVSHTACPMELLNKGGRIGRSS